MSELIYPIGVSLIPGIGHVGAKKLIAYCGGAEAVFKEKKQNLLKIPGFGEKAVQAIQAASVMERAEQEVAFLEKEGIQAVYYLNDDYPQRLLHCEDGPLILYSKGKIDWNAKRMISIVGTRMATVKGKEICQKLVEDLVPYQATIVSGLAYGIDITAHKAAMKQELPTIAILASGLDQIYPKNHANYAREMQENGGIATDYLSETKMVPANFAERNRIVAGLSDAVIVVESSAKGGSLITADLANGYNRDVFAVPGRIDDSQSVGCNRLIKTNRAVLLESVKDIEYMLGWELNQKEETNASTQKQLFVDLNEEETQLLEAFENENQMGLDELSLKAKLPISKTTSLLLTLEFKGVIRSLPGKVFQRI